MNTSKLNLTEQYKEHSAQTDKIVAMLRDRPLEYQATIKQLELENMELRRKNEIFLNALNWIVTVNALDWQYVEEARRALFKALNTLKG